MYTGRDFVSQVRGMNKLLSSDNMINDRTILKEGRMVGLKLVKQAVDQRKLLNSPYLFAFLPCLELEEAPLSECCEYTSDKKISRSKKKLPKIGESNWGLVIQGVFGLEGTIKLKPTNPSRYANLIRMDLKTKDTFYWVLNDRLYTTNPSNKAVNIYLFPAEEIDNALLFPGENCSCLTDNIDRCTSELDKPFYFPGEKITDIAEIVYKRLLVEHLRIQQDITDDDVDQTGLK